MTEAAVSFTWGVTIPLRDGVRLSATLYLPREHQLPSPTIVMLTPYTAQYCHPQGLYFAGNGYPFVVVDVRGRANSEGVFRPNINEARDGYDVVEWIAGQSYCNGRVSMWGGSYSGYAQWAAAKEFPPHLTAIVPVASPYMGVDFPMRNNIAWPYLMKWLTLVSGRTLQDKLFWGSERFWSDGFRRCFEAGLPFKKWDAQLGNPSSTFQEWLAHPEPDAYWDDYNPTAAQYAAISLPILTITGACDVDQPGALMHYREHMRHASQAARSQHYLVIGPWDHSGTRRPERQFLGLTCGPASLVDIPKLHVQWYDWTLRDGPKPEFLQRNVAYYVIGADKWRYAQSLEAVTARSEPLYLQSSENPTDVFRSGTLAAGPQTSAAPDYYVYDPRDTSLSALESSVDPDDRADQRMVHASVGKHLVYHSAAFAVDTEVSGFFRLCAWLSIDQPDTDLRANVYRIDRNGQSLLLGSDCIRARYREGLREGRLIKTTEPLRYEFDRFMFISCLLSQGDRLRLILGPINSIYSQKNHNSGGAVSEESIEDARPVTVKLFHDRAHPSALYVPYAQTAEGAM